MKKKKQYRLLIGICALSFLSSCDFEEINTNPFEMTEEMGKWDNVAVGGLITALERTVFPVGTQADDTDVINQYQIAYNVSADSWSGFFGQNNNWNSGNNHTTFYLQDDWVSATYTNAYTEALSSWKSLKQEAEKAGTPEVFALAQVLKISAWHKALESFGPIPYVHAGEAALVIPFDSEEEAYNAIFADLENAIKELTDAKAQNKKITADYDAVYKGDPEKWIKYANSLMLRLAVRLKSIAPETAKKYVKMALENETGVMTSKSDEAQMSTGAGMVFRNNIDWLANNYYECRMGSAMFSYLVGYEDPRLSKYFLPSESEYAVEAFDGQKYQAVPPGHTEEKRDDKAVPPGFFAFSKPNIVSSTPTYWMRASEVYFLKAEAALEWPELGIGDPASLYQQGVETSFDENGLSSNEAAAYLASDKQPAAFNLNMTSPSFTYSNAAPTSATPDFSTAATKEQKLEKIMIQKWIALYPNGQEAWTEWRRTGYPKLHTVKVNRGQSQGVTDASKGIRRMVYPRSFYQSAEDRENYEQAVKKLKDGEDTSTSRLWWDTSDKN